jgi:hypothetical protein
VKPKTIKKKKTKTTTTTTPSLLDPVPLLPQSRGKNTHKTTKIKTHPKELNEKP